MAYITQWPRINNEADFTNAPVVHKMNAISMPTGMIGLICFLQVMKWFYRLSLAQLCHLNTRKQGYRILSLVCGPRQDSGSSTGWLPEQNP
jgi:hypothetical protein